MSAPFPPRAAAPSAATRAADPAVTEPVTQPPVTRPDLEPVTEERTRLDRGWSVVVWDDPINLMNYVVYVFQKLFGFDQQTATKHMLEVHNEGRSVVATTHRERAEFYVTRLHGYGLQATLERGEG